MCKNKQLGINSCQAVLAHQGSNDSVMCKEQANPHQLVPGNVAHQDSNDSIIHKNKELGSISCHAVFVHETSNDSVNYV